MTPQNIIIILLFIIFITMLYFTFPKMKSTNKSILINKSVISNKQPIQLIVPKKDTSEPSLDNVSKFDINTESDYDLDLGSNNSFIDE